MTTGQDSDELCFPELPPDQDVTNLLDREDKIQLKLLQMDILLNDLYINASRGGDLEALVGQALDLRVPDEKEKLKAACEKLIAHAAKLYPDDEDEDDRVCGHSGTLAELYQLCRFACQILE